MPTGDVLPKGLDGPRHFATWGERERGWKRVRVVAATLDVGEVDSGGIDPDQHLPRSGDRDRHFGQDEDVGRPKLCRADRFHCVCSLSRSLDDRAACLTVFACLLVYPGSGISVNPIPKRVPLDRHGVVLLGAPLNDGFVVTTEGSEDAVAAGYLLQGEVLRFERHTSRA